MKFIFKLLFSFLLFCFLNQAFSATPTASLSVSSVKVTDNKHVRVNFSEPIDPESVVLKIMKQSDNSTIKLDSISAVADSKTSVDIALDDELVEASSYSLTVIAGIAVSGATITDGASAIQDFITPSPLKVAGEETLNAPANPSAVLTEPTKTTQSQTTSSSTKTETTIPKKENIPTPTEELPLTGPNTLFFLLLSVPLAYFLLRKKSV